MKNYKLIIVALFLATGCVQMIPNNSIKVFNKYEPKELGCNLINHGEWQEEKFKGENMVAVAMFTSGNIDYDKNEKTVADKGCEVGSDGYFVMKRWVHNYKKLGGSQNMVTVYYVKHEK